MGEKWTCGAAISGGPAGVTPTFTWSLDGTALRGTSNAVTLPPMADGVHGVSVQATAGTEQASSSALVYSGLVGQITSLVSGGETSDPSLVVDHVKGLGGMAVIVGILTGLAAGLDFLGRMGSRLPGPAPRPATDRAPPRNGRRPGPGSGAAPSATAGTGSTTTSVVTPDSMGEPGGEYRDPDFAAGAIEVLADINRRDWARREAIKEDVRSRGPGYGGWTVLETRPPPGGSADVIPVIVRGADNLQESYPSLPREDALEAAARFQEIRDSKGVEALNEAYLEFLVTAEKRGPRGRR